MMIIKEYDLNWSTFEIVNNNTTQAFENMCRLLFQQQFLSKDTILNSKPNHPGIEVSPVEHSDTGNIISFQSKYFKYRTDYSQIKSSMDQVIKHYSEDLDTVYLYSNTEINKDAKSFIKIVELLEEHGITIELITNNAILDSIRDKPIITTQFFNKNFLDKSWFVQQRKISLDIMEMRYNNLFNITTETENLFNYFLMNNKTVELINKKLETAIDTLESLLYRVEDYNHLIERIIYKVETLAVNTSNVLECLEWNHELVSFFEADLKDISKKIEGLEASDSREKNRNKIFNLKEILLFPDLLTITEKERSLIQNKSLIIKGAMGTGKSQLLSEKLNQLINQDEHAIMLPGQAFLGTDNIEKQVMSFLKLSFEFDELLSIFESIGEVSKKYTYIFIDAINESESTKIWSNGLQALIDKINNFENIRLAISIRNGFEDILFSKSVQDNIIDKNITEIEHHGFYNNSIIAIKEFLNHNNIPFSPSYYFDSNMINPLFLTMFCKVYDGNQVNFTDLLKRYIEYVDREVQDKIGSGGTISIIEKIINEIAAIHLKNDKLSISEEEILQLKFWDIYGLAQQKLLLISILKRNGILLQVPSQGELHYRFGYNLLEEFIYAKTIIDKYDDQDDLRKYLHDELLAIEDEKIMNYKNINIFVITTALYREKFNEECIDVIMNLKDNDEKKYIITKFIESFSLRNSEDVEIDIFRKYLKIAEVESDVVFDILIENSLKINHELNSEYLHSILFKLPLADRDYIWTIYINNLSDNFRLIQLIEYYSESTKSVELLNEKQVDLLVTLFSWTLTSSNRYIRDKATKAIIEILKEYINLCLPLLKQFEKVNDPYVYQRIYSVVYGVCMKSQQMTKEKHKEIGLYVYGEIFDKDLVYPDILCRDYARQIIERYIYLYPDNSLNIDLTKLRPPYKSTPIPIIVKEVDKNKLKEGMNLIASSMAPDKSQMMYGDFGRYEFQSALSNFEDIDVNHLYKYALEIIKEIGYEDDLFKHYDSSLTRRDFSRHNHQKTERIGKKYQWIAMYQILAQVSDTYKLENYWDENLTYNGPWIPYVRDFDPTLNLNNMEPTDIPIFNEFINDDNKFIQNDYSDKNIKLWTEKKDDSFEKNHEELLITDSDDNEWIVLYQHQEYTKKDKYIHDDYRTRKNTQIIWTISQAYLVPTKDLNSLKQHLDTKNFMGRWFPEGYSSKYELFNREYSWAPGIKDLVSESWIEYEKDTGKFESKEDTFMKPYFNSDDEFILEEVTETVTEPIKKKVADILPTSLHFLWEQQYDASQKESTNFTIPSAYLINKLGLEQREIDGYYYNNNNELVAFDRELSKKGTGLVIRKTALEYLLEEKDLSVFWTCIGEKQFIKGEITGQEYSEWSGFHYLENNEIIGQMDKYSNDN
ncbi:hypothetical protein [Jeotgalicoccus halotolerans]|uniref:Uncharacterized protein n=1 Tax=Jeotgalicoccus halotolerans TaxID=157227 RepID=A0A3E0AZZ7_9STAP|nr:hypothetical protein [Jeotgalicoccus halotolerans]REG25255.1 hypothetical protein DFR63_0279 [Jeotgalicoccus halotolerans]